MRDRGQYYRDTFFLDSVEVLKGPSSMLFGRGSTGGVINQVSKVPSLARSRDHRGRRHEDYYRATGDLNEPLSDTRRSHRRDGRRTCTPRATSCATRTSASRRRFAWVSGRRPKSRSSALVLHNHDMPDYGLPPLNGGPAPVSSSNFYGLTDDRTVQDVQVTSANVEHKSAPAQLRNQTQYNHYTTDAQETGPNRVGTIVGNVFTALPTDTIGNTTDLPLSALYVLLGSHDRHITDESIYNQTDLIAKFDTGQMRHSMWRARRSVATTTPTRPIPASTRRSGAPPVSHWCRSRIPSTTRRRPIPCGTATNAQSTADTLASTSTTRSS